MYFHLQMASRKKSRPPPTLNCDLWFSISMLFSVSAPSPRPMKYKRRALIQQKENRFPWTKRWANIRTIKPTHWKLPMKKVYLLPPQQLNDILSHHADEEQCAQNMIVLFFLCLRTGCFHCAHFIAWSCIKYIGRLKHSMVKVLLPRHD